MRPLALWCLSAIAASAAALTGVATGAAAFGTVPGLGESRPASPPPAFNLPDDDLATPDAPAEVVPDAATPDPASPLAIHYDNAGLPPPVAAMRQAIIAAARTGDVEALRPVIGRSTPPPLFSSLGEGDPIDILKAASGDEGGREILAILVDVLESGYAVRGEGTAQARYVWPYFAELSPDSLTPPQLVDLYRVMTSGDFDAMRGSGSYEFYRVELTADGRWLMFMNGE
jgi:hypothetical protein